MRVELLLVSFLKAEEKLDWNGAQADVTSVLGHDRLGRHFEEVSGDLLVAD